MFRITEALLVGVGGFLETMGKGPCSMAVRVTWIEALLGGPLWNVHTPYRATSKWDPAFNLKVRDDGLVGPRLGPSPRPC